VLSLKPGHGTTVINLIYHQSYLPSGYRTWKEDIIWQLRQQYKGDPIPRATVTIEILGSARGDLDNLAGALLDALVQAGILVDDRLSCVPQLTITHIPGKQHGARVMVDHHPQI
jgi:Holliday junction resolvase RusA-like endonuclease